MKFVEVSFTEKKLYADNYLVNFTNGWGKLNYLLHKKKTKIGMWNGENQ